MSLALSLLTRKLCVFSLNTPFSMPFAMKSAIFVSYSSVMSTVIFPLAAFITYTCGFFVRNFSVTFFALFHISIVAGGFLTSFAFDVDVMCSYLSGDF